MLDGIPLGQLLDGFGTVVIIVIVGFLIFTGRLATRREVDTRMADKDEAIHYWRESAKASGEQVAKLIDNNDLQVRTWETLRRIAEEKEGHQ